MRKNKIAEAISQAKEIKEAAETNAKKVLVESLTPSIKSLITKSLYEANEDEEDVVVELTPEEGDEFDSAVEEPEVEEPEVEETEETEETNEAKKKDDEEEDEMELVEMKDKEDEEEKLVLTKEELRRYVRRGIKEVVGAHYPKEKGELAAYGETEFDADKESDLFDLIDDKFPSEVEAPEKGKNTVFFENRRRNSTEGRNFRERRLTRKIQEEKKYSDKLQYALRVWSNPKLTVEQKNYVVKLLDKYTLEFTKRIFERKISSKKPTQKSTATAAINEQLNRRPNEKNVDEQKALRRLQELAGVLDKE